MFFKRILISIFISFTSFLISCEGRNDCSIDTDCFTCYPPPTTVIECKDGDEIIIIKDSKFIYDGQKKHCENRKKEDLLKSYQNMITTKLKDSCIFDKYYNLRRSCTGQKVCQIKTVEIEDCPSISKPLRSLHSYIYYQYTCLKAKIIDSKDLSCLSINEGIFNVAPKGNISSLCIKFKPDHIRLSIKIYLKSGLDVNKNCKYGTLNGQQIKILFSKRNNLIFGNVQLKNTTHNNVTIMLVGCEWLYGSITVERILSSLSLREISTHPINLSPSLHSNKNPDKITFTIEPTDEKPDGKTKRTKIGIILTCVISFVIILLIVTFGVFYLKRRRRNDKNFSNTTTIQNEVPDDGVIYSVSSENEPIKVPHVQNHHYQSGALDDTPNMNLPQTQRLLPKVPPPAKEE